MSVRFRCVTLLLYTLLYLPARVASAGMVERFDAEVARIALRNGPPAAALRGDASPAADFSVEQRLSISLDFPGDVRGAMYSGSLHGEAAIFTRASDYLDATVLHGGDTSVTSFNAVTRAAMAPDNPFATAVDDPRRRARRSVGPGHVEDPNANSLHVRFFRHDDLVDRTARELHARYAAWWLADMALRVLPAERMVVSYWERVPWLTSMAYGDSESLYDFDHALKLISDDYGFAMDKTYKNKFILLTAGSPMPGTAGVAFEGGNEAMASIAGRDRVVAHEIGHMLGATHEDSEMRGWWGCDTNMVAVATRGRDDCRDYSAANRRAMRSYMRHGPDTVAPRRMADAPAPR